MLEVKNLSFAYPGCAVPVLKDVSLQLPSAGLFYIVGESGSGKSTFLKVISGLLSPYQGQIIWDGRELSSFSQREKAEFLRVGLSVSSQADLVESGETVRDNLLLPLCLEEMKKSEKENRIANVVDSLSIQSLLSRHCCDLSGGEIKRVSLARALIKDCPVLLLDEPLGPLDLKMRRKLSGLFEEIGKKKLIIVITHNTGELKKEAALIVFKDGRIQSSKHLSSKDKRPVPIQPSSRSRYRFSDMYSSILKMLWRKRKHSFFASFASSLSLISLGLISLISSGISSGLKSALEGSAERNTVLIERRNEEIEETSHVASPYQTAVNLQKAFPSYIWGIGAYYSLNFENTFLNQNTVYFMDGKQKLTLNSLSGRNFMEFTYYKEMEDIPAKIAKMDLNDEQIILGLSSADLSSLVSFLRLDVLSDSESALNAYLSVSDLVLHLDLAASAFSYQLPLLFSVSYVLQTEKSQIIHKNPLFNETFLEEDMRFKTVSDEETPLENPWTVFKAFTLLADPVRKRPFLEKAESSPGFKGICFHQLKEEMPSFYEKKNERTHGRLALLEETKKDIYYSDLAQMISAYGPYLKSACLSDSFYYCSDQGTLTGFIRPVYVSADRSKLNKIADCNYEAQFDFSGFQGSTIIFDDGVIMGDLSQTQKNPLIFLPYLSPPSVLKGGLPSSFDQVLISENLCAELYGDYKKCLNQPLYFTCLKETVFREGGFKNIFVDGMVRVSGIVQGEKNAIYQRPRFLEALGDDQFGFDVDSKTISRALLTFGSDLSLTSVMDDLSSSYPDYRFSLPVKKMAESIDQIISYIDKGLMVFSVFSSLIAGVLLCLVIFLFIREDRLRIQMMEEEGFFANEIKSWYWGVAFLLCLASYLSSSFCLLFFSQLFAASLEAELGIAFKSFFPEMFFLNLLLALIFTLLAGLLSSFQIAKSLKPGNRK